MYVSKCWPSEPEDTSVVVSGVKRRRRSRAIDFPCECEHNNPDSLDARLFFTVESVVFAVAPAVTMDEASYVSWYGLTRRGVEGGGG